MTYLNNRKSDDLDFMTEGFYNAVCRMKDEFSDYCDRLTEFRSSLYDLALSDLYPTFREPIVHAVLEAESNNHITEYNEVNRYIKQAMAYWKELPMTDQNRVIADVNSFTASIKQRNEKISGLDNYFQSEVPAPNNRRRKKTITLV